MSGRTRHWRDGKLITNRKTDRRQTPRTPAHEAPLLRLIFRIPPFIMVPLDARLVATPLGSIEVGPLGNASVNEKSFNRDRVFERAAWFLSAHTPKAHPPFTIAAVLTSSSDPNWSGKWSLAYVDGHVVATQSPTEPLIFPAAA